MKQKVREVSVASSQHLESILHEETAAGWHYRKAEPFFTSGRSAGGLKSHDTKTYLCMFQFESRTRHCYRVEHINVKGNMKKGTCHDLCNERIQTMSKCGMELMDYFPLISFSQDPERHVFPTQCYVMLFSIKTTIDEFSKIFKRAAEVADRIDDELYNAILESQETASSGTTDAKKQEQQQQDALSTFVQEVLRLDDELMKQHMGDDWEEDMASHAITAEDITETLLPFHSFLLNRR